jgi:hypothetical protein
MILCRLSRGRPGTQTRCLHPLLSIVQAVSSAILIAIAHPTCLLTCRQLTVLCNRVCNRSLGCLDPQCVLCEHNPHRRCNVNFAPKYLVNDILKAKCEAPIRVEIIDRATGVPVGEEIPDVQLEARFHRLYVFCYLSGCHEPVVLPAVAVVELACVADASLRLRASLHPPLHHTICERSHRARLPSTSFQPSAGP